ncbi:conserved hypothetical protein [Talaromyces stipitatus ATCC 10500]|uniref:Mediator of RNA polymerase II transcription subunit 19 n=1 Tax=Talaromyces stipitatus (strain ATCC 10500 / CBS 375.48 / QM 6759 / NRRL 1006) TaxID=441959 RepID=B8LVV2_TALSN|nr:uncharacterized protein TSTA_076830 [Talaromyces stipitatus ATCC 10500]EED24318.1 conserved hypothetical protein [Talaromyces stipitatus ATCC 10500]
MSDSFSLAGNVSPTSFSASNLKANHSPDISNNSYPQTPTSPPLMSVGAQNYASNFAHTHTSPSHTTTSNGQPLSSPPSSTPMSTQNSQQPTVSATASFPTPASSVSGHLRNTTPADESEAADKSWGQGIQNSHATGSTEFGSVDRTGHRRTDHDRHKLPEGSNMKGRPPVADVDMMDIDSKEDLNSSIRDSSLDALQQDIGTAFHLCKSVPTITGPDPSFDLISLYGLGPIGRSVMRADPTTGEKINRLRKSYEGKLKGLGLSGRNKAVKNENGQSGGLRHLMMWPEEEWQIQKVHGKEIKFAEAESSLQKLQMRAMKLEPGPIPNSEYWEDILGHEKPAKHTNIENGKRAVSTPNALRPTNQANGVPATTAAPERARPTRGKKRHYDDNSFVGYGEGFVDDDDEAALYSNSEDRSGKKKRKKVFKSSRTHYQNVSYARTDGQLWGRHVWNRG